MEEISDQEDSHPQEASSAVYRRERGPEGQQGTSWVSGQSQCKLRAHLQKGFRRRREEWAGHRGSDRRERAAKRQSGGQITKDTLCYFTE